MAAAMQKILPNDLEKSIETEKISSVDSDEFVSSSLPVPGRLKKWNAKIESLAGLEARGITRVLPEERHAASWAGYVQMALLWFSMNLTANNLAVGLLGPLVFKLGFVDSALCSVFGAVVGSLGTAYMSIWGAQSGNRTMIVARYFMGYWPSKIACLLNIIIMVGYGTIDSIIGGQLLSAVSGGSMSIVVGIIIVAFVTWVVAVFGLAVFQIYERWAWLPQVIVLFVLVGSAGPKFDPSIQSIGDTTTINANRLSFFSLCLSIPVSWTAAASDFYVYYPENTTKWKIFLMTFSGSTFAYAFVNLLGVGLASGINTVPAWATAYKTSSGALILAGYGGLGGFGKFCGVIVALGVIANNIPGTYSAALGFQVLGRYGKAVPRYLWVCVVVAIYFVCAIAGRNNLFDIFENFCALMGYWLTIFISIVLEEHLIFRRGIGFDWTAWEDRKRLPVGIAALIAFLVGWAGAIVSMSQAWYVGPVAKMVGDSGSDLGIWVGSGFALFAYPPLRFLELKKFHR